jgi:aspartate aminotransferase, cytoplasmic
MLTIDSYLGLNPTQCCKLVDHFHIYLPTNGRINIAGLNDSCIERVASAIDTVVREMICGGLDSR